MDYKHNKEIVPLAKALRKNMTKKFLEQYGINVIRISNLDINKNFEGVCIYIDNEVKQSLSQLR